MAVTVPPGIAIQLLGPIAVEWNGRPRTVGGRRQRALLALLAMDAGRVVPTDALVDELWAGEPTDGAEVTIRSYVSRLRGTLGGGAEIRSVASGYVLDIDPASIDVARFELLLRQAEEALAGRNARRAAERAGMALALWRGEPFGDVADEGRIRQAKERLTERRLQALEARIEAELALGRSSELVDELEGLVREHPYREAFWRQLMTALYRAERQADALTAYHRARTALDENLGIEPGEELKALEAAILRQDLPVVTVAEERHNLPEFLTGFVGRERDIQAVADALSNHRMVTLVGVGGVGKTRLAVEVARGELGNWPDGVFFVDLSPIAESERVADVVLSVMGVREQPGQGALERLVEQLRDVAALIVLDNCEHVRDGAAAVALGVLRSCPRLRILATSREVLGVPGENAHPVPPLSLPSSEDAASAGASEAVRLFLVRARAARPDLPEDDSMLEIAARICAELEGLPLAIELAAARARVLAPAEIEARLHDRFQFLVSWRRMAPTRHRTLREAMDWSYDLLDDESRRLLARLSVFAGGFTLDAVAAVCADGDEHHALEGLERLVDASLVIARPGAEHASRYWVLETVRQYGAERLEAAGDVAAARERHAAFFADFAAEVRRPLRSVDPIWLRRVAVDRENFGQAFAFSCEVAAWDRALVIAEAVWWAWWIWGETRQAREWLEAALAHGGESDPWLVARAQLGAAGIAWAQADLQAAERWAALARTAFATIGDSLSEGSALNTLGLIAHGRGDYEEAERVLEAALVAYRRPEVDPAAASRGIAVAIDNLGSTAYEYGDMERAEARYREALQLNQERGDLEGVAMNQLHLATARSFSGDPQEARRLLPAALRTYADVGFPQYLAECLESACLVAAASDNPTAVARLLGASATMRAQAGSPPVPFLARLRESQADRARKALGDGAFQVAFDDGQSMPTDAAVRWTLEILER